MMTLLYVERHVWTYACVTKLTSSACFSWWWLCENFRDCPSFQLYFQFPGGLRSFVLIYWCQLTFNNTVEKQVLLTIVLLNTDSSSAATNLIISYCLLLRIFSCLVFYVVIFIKALKNCTGSILKVSIISLHLLIYSFLTHLWMYSHHINLSGDIELNPGPKQYINQCFSVCPWNLNSAVSPKFSKIQSLIAFNCIHKFDIICLSESYLNSEIL